MNACDLMKRLHQHRSWTNRKLLDAVAPLSDEQLHRSLAIGQGSIWRTLTHLMGAEYIWLEALLGDESPTMPGDLATQLPGNQQGEAPIGSMQELTDRWRELELRWGEYLSTLTEESLDEIVHKKSPTSKAGTPTGTSRADILLHVCTHAQYTTAQLINMLRQVGVVSLPDPMLITLARSEAAL